jgi:hypothetical protein
MIELNEVAHTGENISEAILSELKAWELSEIVVGVASDSAASQVKANRIMKFPFLPCVAHTIQLAIRDAIDA